MTASVARVSNICQCGAAKELRLLLCSSCWFFLETAVREKLVRAMTGRRIAVDVEIAYQAAVTDLSNMKAGAAGGKIR